MTKEEVKEYFLNQIESYLSECGFSLNKSTYLAFRKTNNGFDSPFFDINDMVDQYSITTALRIRNKQIEELRGKINPRYAKQTQSTVLEKVFSVLERFDREDLDYEIENPGNLVNENTIDEYLKAFKQFMELVGLKFFENFNTISDFDKWFNSQVLNGTYNFNRGPSANKAVCGLIASKLSNNENYEVIYKNWINGISPKDIETFAELKRTKEYLDKL